jgi:hypothetical protein
MKILIFLLGILFVFNSFAREDRYLGRSPRGLLMGDAYTSAADDEYTLYYNPALLARHGYKSFSFWAINPSITVTNILKDPDQFNQTGDSTTEFADQFMDFPVHLGMNAAPGFKMGRFGITAIVNYATNFSLMNKVTPMLDIDHRFDKGFIAGYGMPLNGDLAMGVSVKYLQREGLQGTYNLVGKTMMDAISAGEPDKILETLGQVKGSGWGVDFGLDYAIQNGPSLFTMSLALLDIYTILHTEENDLDKEVQAQPLQANFGTSWALEAAGFGWLITADIRNLEDPNAEFLRRVKLGTELKISPLLSALVGYNSGGYSYGIKFDTGLINLYAGFYDVEIGEKVGQQRSSRGVIYVSLFDFTFDG